MLACSPSAIARPAASSAPVLSREPDESCKSVFCSDAWVIDNWFCDARDETLFKILSDISKLLCLGFPPGTEPCGLYRLPISPLRSIRWCCLLRACVSAFPLRPSFELSDVSISDVSASYQDGVGASLNGPPSECR